METGHGSSWTLASTLAATVAFCNLLPAAAQVMGNGLETVNKPDEISQDRYRSRRKAVVMK